MPPLIRRVLLVLAVCATIVGGLWWAGRPAPVAVTLTAVARGTVEATIANTRAGEVESCRRAKLSTIAGGRIESIAVVEGQHVVAGQELMTLWNDDQRAQLAVATALLDSARKRVGEVCVQAANAADEAARQHALRERGFVSPSREEQAAADARSRAAACETARAEVRSAQARIDANLAEQRRMRLTAPFDGTIAKITGKLGEYTTPSPPGVPTPPAIDLIDQSCLYVKAPLDEVDAPRIAVGQRAAITLDALPGRRFEGRVRRVAPYVAALEKQARTVDVEVDFSDPDDARGLLVGYSADVEILLERRDGVLRIPTAAIRDGDRVLILGDDDRLAERRIGAGIANWEYTEILDGLGEGERVVTSLEREGVRAGAPARADPGPSR